MSQGDVEVVRELAAAWRRGDREAWLAAWDDEAEFYPLRAQLEGHAYRGRGGLREFLTEWDEDWEHARFDVNEIRDAGDQVVALAQFQALGRGSGVELDYPIGVVITVRQRRVVYARFYSIASDALEAVGLSEPDPTSG
jgi:ketosteroid isomerase-like protein